MMLERTRDMGLVAKIMAHPAIFRHIAEDGTDKPEPVDHDGCHWMLIRDAREEIAGVFLVYARNKACFEMHTCILPEFWGAKAGAAAQQLLKWAFSDTDCQKMITAVPGTNRAAYRFALANGMQNEGINRASYQKNGQMIDQVMLGITKKEWESCQQQSQ